MIFVVTNGAELAAALRQQSTMSAIEPSVDQRAHTAHGEVKAALERIARVTRFYDFENAWSASSRPVPRARRRLRCAAIRRRRFAR